MTKVLVLADCPEGRVTPASVEAIAFAQTLAARLKASVEAATLTADAAFAEALTGYQLGRVVAVHGPSLSECGPESFCVAVQEVIRHSSPDLLVMPHSYQNMDLVPRLAARIGVPLVTDCTDCRPDEVHGVIFTRPVYRSKLLADLRVEGKKPWMMTLQRGACPADRVVAGSAPLETIRTAAEADKSRRRSLEKVGLDKKRVDLTRAEVIVGAGRGIRNRENLALLRELADLLGAELGASRPVVDSEWLERDRQIGSSGQSVSPRLYVAVGISGAIQHVVGIKNSGCIVAINTDPQAPIFSLATYGIVGDMAEVVPALTKKLREAAR
jgi:electron transfer flavoprotein alpha subunit